MDMNEFNETPAEESGNFKLIEEGEYDAKLMDCKLDMTKTPQRLTFVYEISQGENKGKKLFGNYQLAGRGIGFLKKDLDTLGLDFSNVGSSEDIATLVWDAMPLNVVIFVNQKEYQGKIYNNCYLNELVLAGPGVGKTYPAPAKAPVATGKPLPNRTAPKPAATTSASRAPARPQTTSAARKPAPAKRPADDFGPEPDFDSADEIPF